VARRDKILRTLVLAKFVVTMKTGETFEGLLQTFDESTLVLVRADAVTVTTTAETRIPVDGALYIARSDIAYMQRVGA
jgi:small nuclear ribonucleoprotein (snRNP)-like protein